MNIALSFFRGKSISHVMSGVLIILSILFSILFQMILSEFDNGRLTLSTLVLGIISGVFLTIFSVLLWAKVKKVNLTKVLCTENLRQQKEFEKKYNDLRVAVDAHALVAITDARGVITQVNDKFCTMSQYSREELIGQTHGVVNSGQHSPEFFQDLWHTINNGNVWVGDICNRAKDGTLYWVHSTIVPLMGDNGKPNQFIAIRADITLRKKAEAKACMMAMHDDLTGLPNRYLMRDRLLRAISSKLDQPGYGAVLMMDLDHFKEVNDTLGHALGDELLEQTTKRLISTVRKTDTVARFGGDEFVIILDYVGLDFKSSLANTDVICESLRKSLAQPYQLGGQQLEVTPSLGVVLFSSNKEEPGELIKQADIALYRAKESGRNQVCFFDPVFQEEAIEKALMIRDLRKALDKNELVLFYQPIVDIDETIRGVEALIRWIHPKYGVVSPEKFIPLAEKSGLILSIGEWVLKTACFQQSEWQKDPISKNWVVSINVSAKQLAQVDFIDTVKNVLKETGALASQISLEITETVLQDNIEDTIEKMNLLRQVDVHFSLDDFGTGYSSFSYLKRLPIDHLKIDKSFVDDIFNTASDADIVRTIILLAKNLGVGVIAEGVESREQFDWLLENGCTYYQGYFFSRPLPQDQLFAVLENRLPVPA